MIRLKREKLVYGIILLSTILIFFSLIVLSFNFGLSPSFFLTQLTASFRENTQRSSVDLSLMDEPDSNYSDLNLSFHITSKDRVKLDDFVNRLGVQDNFIDGISLKIDRLAADKIRAILPVSLNIDFNSSGLSFSTKGSLKTLSSSLAFQSFQMATGEGKLRVSYGNDKSYSVEITEPQEVLKMATESAQLSLSKNLNGLFPILSRIVKINVVVNGDTINGGVILK